MTASDSLFDSRGRF